MKFEKINSNEYSIIKTIFEKCFILDCENLAYCIENYIYKKNSTTESILKHYNHYDTINGVTTYFCIKEITNYTTRFGLIHGLYTIYEYSKIDNKDSISRTEYNYKHGEKNGYMRG